MSNQGQLPTNTMRPKPARQVSDVGSNALPWSQSPFAHSSESESDDGELESGELRVKAPEEVPWIDLLLEIAMTTAFASLTDGTPILHVAQALSYVCYFIFVWWIWVAQVAYNMRFRQADWVHRIMVFAQLIVFSALAAFTEDFDITNGLSRNPDPDKVLADQLFGQTGSDQSGLAAFNFRKDTRLPRLNARGVAMTMAISRLFLLVQYSLVFYHARHGLKRTSLVAHIVPLLFSSLSYFAAFILLGVTANNEGGPSPAVEIGKLVLFYLPILVEIASHFVALSVPGFVRYSTESVHARSGTVYLIILGAGLDKITNGFKAIVGNAGLGINGIPLFIAAAVIFIGLFSLYFGTPGSTRKFGRRRALSWLFAQFFFLAALIVTLQGVATALSFANLWSALLRTNNAVAPVYNWVNTHPGVNISSNSTDFTQATELFSDLGLAFDDFVQDMNIYIVTDLQTNNNTNVPTGELLETVNLYWNILDTFKTPPDDGSLLQARFQAFLNANPGNTTVLNQENFQDIRSDIVTDKGSPALWFYPAAGSTLLALVLMSLIKGLPQDKWEWAIITCRFLVGSGTCILGVLDRGASQPIFDSDGNRTRSKIWALVVGDDHLLLIIMAIIMAVLLVIEMLIAYAANRSYNSFGSINFLDGPERRRSRRSANAPSEPYSYSQPKEDAQSTDEFNPYNGVNTSDGGQRRRARFENVTETGEVELTSVLYDPYHGQDSSDNTLYSRSGR